MGWKKLIMGEKMPDKNDPKYAERYEKEVSAGRKWAKFLRIDKAAGYIQYFACKHPKWFLAVVFGIVLGCLTLNVYRMVQIYNRPKTEQAITASQHQEELMKQKRSKPIIVNRYDPDRTEKQD